MLADLLYDGGITAVGSDQFEAAPAIVDIVINALKQFLQGQQASAPSWTLALRTTTSKTSPKTSTPRSSPPSDVLTLWLSITTALGCGSRP